MLDLGDAQLEVTDRVARCSAELRRGTRCHAPATLAKPRRLAAPAVEHVRDDGTNLIPLDADTRGDLGRQLVRMLRDEGDGADPCQAERLEGAALASGHDRGGAMPVVADAVRAWTRRARQEG